MFRYSKVGLLCLSLIAPAMTVMAMEDLDVKIDRMKIKEDKEDLTESRMNVTKWQQVVEERKKMRDAAQANYDENAKKSAKGKLTRESKNRLDDAARSLQRAERKLTKAQESLREDETELNQAYQEMEKSKRD